MKSSQIEKKAIEKLRKNNLKVTRSRVEVLNILQNSAKPLSHSQIMEELETSGNWDKVTIYRTLGEFTEKQMIKSLMSNQRVTFFEIQDQQHEHGHFSCEKCGKMECLVGENFSFSWKNNVDYKVMSVEIIVKGLCGKCK